jgi:hypothetical protein
VKSELAASACRQCQHIGNCGTLRRAQNVLRFEGLFSSVISNGKEIRAMPLDLRVARLYEAELRVRAFLPGVAG